MGLGKQRRHGDLRRVIQRAAGYAAEALESRLLLSAVSWTGAGDGKFWTDPNNWSGHAIPGFSDDVTIDVPTHPAISVSAAQDINSLVSTSPISTTATFQVNTTAQMSANLDVGGAVQSGTYNFSPGAKLVVDSFAKLVGITVNGDMDAVASQGGAASISNGLTLNGTMTIGNAAGTRSGFVTMGDNVFSPGTLGGNATIVFGGSAANGIQIRSGTWTIGPTVTIRGKSGSFGFVDPLHDAIVNQGTMDADAAGSGIIVPGIDNQGTVEATSGGTISFFGNNEAGATLAANGGIFTTVGGGGIGNSGSIQDVNGGTMTLSNLQNFAGKTVTATGSTLSFKGSLKNQGTINVTNTTVYLAGDFSQADMGVFNRTGGTVNVTGKIEGDILLNASTGSWNLQTGGSLAGGGTVTENDGQILGFAASNLVLQNETINGDFAPILNSDGNFLTVIDKLTVTGTLYLGNAAGTTYTHIFAG
ncbi:MAG: tandem-95 repeat protein, partial [Phycisphaerales bacterium]|nr:tandem-95 repeat protein [Phycisphaerales bacterium]